MDNIATWPYVKLELKSLRKESIFLYSKRHNLQFFLTYRGVTSSGVAISRVTLHDRAEIFVKKTTIYKSNMTQHS